MDLKEFKEIEGFNNYYIAHSPPRVFRKNWWRIFGVHSNKELKKRPLLDSDYEE